MSNPPPPPRRSRAGMAPPNPDGPEEGPLPRDPRHQDPAGPVYSLDDVGEESPEALKEAMLREVVEHAARMTRAVELAKPMESYRARPFVLALVAVVAMSLATYSVLQRPAWVYGPLPEQMPQALREGHVRYAMFLAAERVLAFRDSSGGTLPRTLREAGDAWPGMSYHVEGRIFELRAHVDSTTPVVYRSTQDPRTLMRSAVKFLRTDPR